jgi:DNA helicase HerA-like ATPase
MVPISKSSLLLPPENFVSKELSSNGSLYSIYDAFGLLWVSNDTLGSFVEFGSPLYPVSQDTKKINRDRDNSNFFIKILFNILINNIKKQI